MRNNKTVVHLLHGMAACVACIAGSAAFAGGRPDDTSSRWFGDFSGGYAFAQGDTSDNVDDDWMLSGGAMFWPADWPAGIVFNLAYGQFDLTDEAVQNINTAIILDPNNAGLIDGGDVETWQLTVNGMWGPGSRDNGFYLTGGVGAYYLKGTITETGLVYYPPFCDPWYWWWCFPGGVGLGSIPTGSDSTTEFGWNLGLGFSLEAGNGQFFMEARYHDVSTDNDDVTFVPVTFGYRW